MVTINKKVRRYTDFNLSFTKNPINGNLAIKNNEDAVRQSVRNILLTRRGEKLFDPNFGSPIYEYLFENISPPALRIIQDEVRRAINTYEPRFKVSDVITKIRPGNDLQVEVIGFIVNTTDPITVTVLFERLR